MQKNELKNIMKAYEKDLYRIDDAIRDKTLWESMFLLSTVMGCVINQISEASPEASEVFNDLLEHCESISASFLSDELDTMKTAH